MNFSEAFDVSRCISHGWTALKRAPLPLFCGSFLVTCTESGGCNGGGNRGSWPSGDQGGGPGDLVDLLPPELQALGLAAIIALVALALVIGVLVFVFRCWLSGGYIQLQREVLQTGAGRGATLAAGTPTLGRMVLWRLLYGVVGLSTMILAGSPGGILIVAGMQLDRTPLVIIGVVAGVLIALPILIYVTLGLCLGDHAVVLEDRPPVEALERSWDLARGNRLPLLLYLFVAACVQLTSLFAGLLMLCVGVLFTVPASRAVLDAGFTEGFLLATRGREGMAGWKCWDEGP